MADRPGEREAADAVWDALCCEYELRHEYVASGVTNAYDIIECAVREQIAAEIEREAAYARSVDLPERGAILGTAARIARGTP